jgi:hypothetical protein
MKLNDLCGQFDRNEFPAAGECEHPAREPVLAARQAVTAAVQDDEFLVDCLAHELDVLEQRIPRGGLVPFHTLPESGIRFAFGYWPPGSRAGAHEHSAWTITAVCRNKLLVQTFDREASIRQQQLVPKNLFDAEAGRVGFIYEPCIHDPRNPTKRWSLSLHVSSPRDGEPLDGDQCLPLLEETPTRRSLSYDHPYAWLANARHHHVLIDTIARVVAETRVPASAELLARCGRLGTASTRRFIENAGWEGTQTGNTRATLALVRHQLVLSCRDVDGGVALGVETPQGWAEQLRMTRVGREALDFCANNATFEVRERPGSLTGHERWRIAEALEESGMFELQVS